mmetsp:Transcript_36206/g.84852  ORF Transcript_36206/g.84852 Transcript_36206/m.84852 type:complete len:364 (-) Transcript_36206:3228-4319(-)
MTEVVVVALALAHRVAQALSVTDDRVVGVHAHLVWLAGVVPWAALIARQAHSALIVHAHAPIANLVLSALVRVKARRGTLPSLPNCLEAGVAGAVHPRLKVHQDDSGLRRHPRHVPHRAVEGSQHHRVGRVAHVATLHRPARVDRDKVALVKPKLGEAHRQGPIIHLAVLGGRRNDPVAGGASVVDFREPLPPALGTAREGRAVGQHSSGLGEGIALALSAAPRFRCVAGGAPRVRVNRFAHGRSILREAQKPIALGAALDGAQVDATEAFGAPVHDRSLHATKGGYRDSAGGIELGTSPPLLDRTMNGVASNGSDLAARKVESADTVVVVIRDQRTATIRHHRNAKWAAEGCSTANPVCRPW